MSHPHPLGYPEVFDPVQVLYLILPQNLSTKHTESSHTWHQTDSTDNLYTNWKYVITLTSTTSNSEVSEEILIILLSSYYKWPMDPNIIKIIDDQHLKGHWTTSTSSPHFFPKKLKFLYHQKHMHVKWLHAKFHLQLQFSNENMRILLSAAIFKSRLQ